VQTEALDVRRVAERRGAGLEERGGRCGRELSCRRGEGGISWSVVGRGSERRGGSVRCGEELGVEQRRSAGEPIQDGEAGGTRRGTEGTGIGWVVRVGNPGGRGGWGRNRWHGDEDVGRRTVGGRAGRAGREDAGSCETFATTEGLRPFEGGRDTRRVGPRMQRERFTERDSSPGFYRASDCLNSQTNAIESHKQTQLNLR
jgi:hypothetical protein